MPERATFMTAPNTEWFNQVYSGDVGSPVIECCCGRTHFGGTGDCMEEGELEKLQAHAKEKPKKYFEYPDCDAVSAVDVCGKPYVIGCECHQLERFEGLIWSERDRILDYFARRHRTMTVTARVLGQKLTAAGVTLKQPEQCCFMVLGKQCSMIAGHSGPHTTLPDT
jgi:hypothetical protein